MGWVVAAALAAAGAAAAHHRFPWVPPPYIATVVLLPYLIWRAARVGAMPLCTSSHAVARFS